ncbi:hypothetical protein NL676_023532 [Syzygium grande]|nr:hypothetical protein NL676_023532 [Syzygium grande]
MANATYQNATKGGDSAYHLGLARLPAGVANEIEDGLSGLGEVGVRGELGVPLSFLHRLQEGAALDRERRPWLRSSYRGRENRERNASRLERCNFKIAGRNDWDFAVADKNDPSLATGEVECRQGWARPTSPIVGEVGLA